MDKRGFGGEGGWFHVDVDSLGYVTVGGPSSRVIGAATPAGQSRAKTNRGLRTADCLKK